MNTHNLCFEQKYKKYQSFLSGNFQLLEVQFSIYLNMLVFVMYKKCIMLSSCFYILTSLSNCGLNAA